MPIKAVFSGWERARIKTYLKLPGIKDLRELLVYFDESIGKIF